MLTASGAAVGSAGRAQQPEGATSEDKKKPKMKYRVLGKTGFNVSEVCFGTYGFDSTPVLEAALKAGINMVCTCLDYSNGNAERAIAPLVGQYRKQMYINSGVHCVADTSEKDILEAIDQSLENTGVECLDIYRAHMIEDVEHLKNPAIPRAFEKARNAGKIKFFGMSTHTADEKILETAIGLGYFDVIQLRYSFIEYPNAWEILERAAEQNIGVVAFKIRAGARESEVEALQKKGLELNQARVRWALANPSITSVCAHFSNFAAVDNYLEAVNKQLSFQDQQLLDEYRRAFDNKYCRNCGSCARLCPYGVDVANVMRYQMYFKYYGFEKEAMARYAELPQERKPLACKECPAPCEQACPHGLATRNNLIEAAEMLNA